MSDQNQSIAALQAANEELKGVVVSTSKELADALANIQADEAAIIAKLGSLGGLTPENQVIVNAVIDDAHNLAVKLQAQADAVKAVADAIPDEAPVEPKPPVTPEP